MKRFLITSLATVSSLALAASVSAAEGGESAGKINPELLVELVTLVVVGGILYNIWVSMSGFGGLLGKALKVVSAGILILSIDTIDEVVEKMTGIGSETLFGEGMIHDVFHSGMMLLGFIVLGIGMSKLSKIVKSMK